jgi:hypothetical protein
VATNLSVPQCFAGLYIFAEQGHGYTEDPGFKTERVSGIQNVLLVYVR